MPPRIRESRAQLIDRILSRCIPEPNSGCLLWLGAVNLKGYGMIRLYGKPPATCCSIVCDYFHGPLQPNQITCHTCDQPSCLEPTHLYAGTKKQNILDYFKRKGDKRRERYAKKVAAFRSQ